MGLAPRVESGSEVEVGKGEAARWLRLGLGLRPGRSFGDALGLDVLLDRLVSLLAVGWKVGFAAGIG
jgi:hypothetical protein